MSDKPRDNSRPEKLRPRRSAAKTRDRHDDEASRRPRAGYGRMNILQSAADVFGKLGFSSTRVEDILDAASISRPTFYRFFRNKDDVFDALDEISHLSLLQLMRSAILSADDPIHKIERCVDAFLRWHAATGPVARVLRQEALHPDSAFAQRRASTMTRILDFFERESQRVRSEHVDPLLFVGLLAAVERIADELHSRHQQISEADIERGKRIIMRIFYGALADSADKLPPIPKITDLPRRERKHIEKQLREKSKQRQSQENAMPKALWLLDFNDGDVR